MLPELVTLPKKNRHNFFEEIFKPIIFPIMNNFFACENTELLHFPESRVSLLRFVDAQARYFSSLRLPMCAVEMTDSPLRTKYFLYMNVFNEVFLFANTLCLACAQAIETDIMGNILNKQDIVCKSSNQEFIVPIHF